MIGPTHNSSAVTSLLSVVMSYWDAFLIMDAYSVFDCNSYC